MDNEHTKIHMHISSMQIHTYTLRLICIYRHTNIHIYISTHTNVHTNKYSHTVFSQGPWVLMKYYVHTP